MSKKYWEVSRIGKDTGSKKTECSFNKPSAKDLEEETRKEFEQIFNKIFEDKKTDKELVERVKKTWEGVERVRTIKYLTLKEQSDFRKFWENNKKKEQPIKKDIDGSVDYNNLVKEQLVLEINRLKVENEQLRNNQILTSSERQERLQKNRQNLEQLESVYLNSFSSNVDNKNNSGLGTMVIIIGILALSLGAYWVSSILRRSKKIKK